MNNSLIINTTKATNKISKNFTINRLIVIGGTLMLSSMIGMQSFPWYLSIPFVFICVGISFWLGVKAPSNSSKPYYLGLIDYIKFKINKKKYYGLNSLEWQEYLRQERDKLEAKQSKKRKTKAKQ